MSTTIDESLLRKRNANDGDDEEEKNKKTIVETYGGSAVAVATINMVVQQAAIKLLCPSESAGSLIGKGGSVISSLNSISGASIKVSQNGECYPMTTDRIILITGEPEKLYVAVDHVVKIILESQETYRAAIGGPFHVRLLIPIAAGGVLIGKSGAIIKSINEKSGAKVNMDDAADPYSTGERIVNVKADALQTMAYAVKLVAAQLLTDKAGAYVNTSTKYAANAGHATAASSYGQAPHNPYAGYQPPTTFQPHFGQTLQYPAEALYNPSVLQQNAMGAGQQSNAQTAAVLAQVQAQVQAQTQGHAALPYGGYQAPSASPSITMTFGVPDKLIGSVLGRGGQGVKEIMQSTSTQIKVTIEAYNTLI